MEATCKIIRLKPECASIAALTKDNKEGVLTTPSELKDVVTKARNVIDTMKEEWQENHSSVSIMEQLCVLRHYIEYLRQYYEENL